MFSSPSQSILHFHAHNRHHFNHKLSGISQQETLTGSHDHLVLQMHFCCPYTFIHKIGSNMADFERTGQYNLSIAYHREAKLVSKHKFLNKLNTYPVLSILRNHFKFKMAVADITLTQLFRCGSCLKWYKEDLLKLTWKTKQYNITSSVWIRWISTSEHCKINCGSPGSFILSFVVFYITLSMIYTL